MNSLGSHLSTGRVRGIRENYIGLFWLVVVALFAATAITAMLAASKPAHAGLLGSIDAAKQKEKGLAADVAQMNGQVKAISGQVAQLRSREGRAEARLARTQERLAREKKRLRVAKRRLDKAFSELEERILLMYKTGKVDVVAVLIKSKNWHDFMTRKEFLDRIAEADAELVGKIKRLKASVEASKRHFELLESQIRAIRDQLRQTRAGLEQESATLVVAKSARQSALESVRGKISALEVKRQEQLASASRVTGFSGGGPAGTPGQGYGSGGPNFSGILNGIVTGRPGDSRPGGRIHQGTDISAPSGTAIKAPSACTINYVGQMQGYGLTVRGSCGLFAHLSGTAVSSGQKVSAGTVIGYVGCSGSCSGPHLHYESSDRFG